MRQWLLIIALILSSISCMAQLKRRPFLGTFTIPLTEDTRKQFKYTDDHGVLIQRVLPNSIGSSAELLSGDILIAINGNKIVHPFQLAEVVKNISSHKMKLSVWRNGKLYETEKPVILYPVEQFSNSLIEYNTVTVRDATLRTIFTRPAKEGKHPVLFYIQGVGCGSVDFGADTTRSEAKLIRQFSNAGFATYRVEKQGMGDSKGGINCSQIDFMTELRGYQEGLRTLKKTAGIDTNNIFIMGHSMGGVMAPLVAANENVKGIIVYGTIVKPLAEYFLESRRLQSEALQYTADSTENFMQAWTKCAPLFFYSKDTSKPFIELYPECSDIFYGLNFRSRSFWQQLANLSMTNIWKNYIGNVLSLWGEWDLIADKSDHEILEKVYNKLYPGKARFIKVSGSTHEFFTANSLQTAISNDRKYNPAAFTITMDWISGIMNK